MSTGTQDQKFGQDFLENIVSWVADVFDPEDVFSDDKLETWAKDNGYVKDES